MVYTTPSSVDDLLCTSANWMQSRGRFIWILVDDRGQLMNPEVLHCTGVDVGQVLMFDVNVALPDSQVC